MPMLNIAYLVDPDTVQTNLPSHFSYDPYVPEKRVSLTPTAGTVVVQASDPVIIHGEGTLPWRIRGAYPTEFQTLWDLYYQTDHILYEFHGYWGEVLDVYFSHFDKPKVRGRLFDLSGQFHVIDVDTEYAAGCNPP